MERMFVQDVKTIPGGVSKTSGKRYPAFKIATLGNGEEVGVSNKLPITIEAGKTYDIDFYVAGSGKKSINTAVLSKEQAQQAQSPAAPVKQEFHMSKEKVALEKEKSDGQARGNYRTIIANFCATMIQVKERLPELEEIEAFNTLLKSGEVNYFEGKILASKSPVDDVPTDVPEGDVFDENGI